MYKVAWIPRFAAGGDDEAAWKHWATAHAELCVAVPGIERYVRNTFETADGSPITNGIVGYACAWWSDRAGFEVAVTTPEWGKLHALDNGDLDPVWTEWGMTAEIAEQLMRVGLGAETNSSQAPDEGTVKQVGILRFKHGMSPSDAFAYWKGTHGTYPLKVPELGHYVQNHAVARIGPTGAEPARPAFDGFSEAYFEDSAAMDVGHRSEGWDELVADAPNLLDRDFRLGGMAKETVIKG